MRLLEVSITNIPVKGMINLDAIVAFNPDEEEVNDLKDRYRKGKVGDVEVKKKLSRAINQFLEPIRERRASYLQDPGRIDEILKAGTRRMSIEAKQTMDEVYKAMGLYRISMP